MILLAALLGTSAGDVWDTPQSFCDGGLCDVDEVILWQKDTSVKASLRATEVKQLAFSHENGTSMSSPGFVSLFVRQMRAEITLEHYFLKVDANKLILALINMLLLGGIGIDRCFLGQTTLGCVKCITCGGCGIWSLVDGVVILINCLSKSKSIQSVGFNASFAEDTVDNAYALTLAFIILTIAVCCCRYCGKFLLIKKIAEGAEEDNVKGAEAPPIIAAPEQETS